MEHILRNTSWNIFLTCTTPCHQMTLNVKAITFIPLVCINIRTTLKKNSPKYSYNFHSTFHDTFRRTHFTEDFEEHFVEDIL